MCRQEYTTRTGQCRDSTENHRRMIIPGTPHPEILPPDTMRNHGAWQTYREKEGFKRIETKKDSKIHGSCALQEQTKSEGSNENNFFDGRSTHHSFSQRPVLGCTSDESTAPSHPAFYIPSHDHRNRDRPSQCGKILIRHSQLRRKGASPTAFGIQLLNS